MDDKNEFNDGFDQDQINMGFGFGNHGIMSTFGN